MMFSKSKLIARLAAGLALCCAMGAAQAAIISADFRAESNLPDFRDGLPQVFERLGQSIGPGYELADTDLVSNPDDWSGGQVWLNYDPATHLVSFTSEAGWDFQTLDVWIRNIHFDTIGEQVTGLALTANALTAPLLTPTLDFTGDSVHIAFSAGQDTFTFLSGAASFRIDTAVTRAVPVAPTSMLFLLGLGTLGLARARRR